MKLPALPKGKKRGLMLPAVLCIMVVLFFIIASLTATSTSSLRQTTYYLQDDEALYAADAGLARALAEYQANNDFGEVEGSGTTVFSGDVSETGAKYSVNVYSNSTDQPLQVPGGASIPPNTALLVSEGKAQAGRSIRRSAALVQKGLGTVQVGSLANNINAVNSKFQAYDSRKESPGFVGSGVDPSALMTQETVMATNAASGTPINLKDSKIEGNIFVGPGGDPNALVSKTGDSTTGQVGVLTEKIEIPPVEVPALPGDDGNGDPPTPETFKPTAYADHVSISQDANGTITIINQCFHCTIDPNGDFAVSENAYSNGAAAKYATGNINTGSVVNSGGSDFNITLNGDNLSFLGDWHGITINKNPPQITVDSPGTGAGLDWANGPHTTYNAPSWLADNLFQSVPPDLTNPSTLDSGFYGDVTIDSGKSVLQDSTTLVVKNLTIKDSGQLNLPANGKDVTIYVTEKLDVTGMNAILNETRSAPQLKVYYTGKQPVQMTGGASSFLTLIAPDADIKLNGGGSTFYGALATNKNLTLNDAEFYYDVATEGVGTGTDGTTMKVLSHQRL